LIVFALAGDSTITSERAISSLLNRKRPFAGEYVPFRYLKQNSHKLFPRHLPDDAAHLHLA
jgi:hypothetical protein